MVISTASVALNAAAWYFPGASASFKQALGVGFHGSSQSVMGSVNTTLGRALASSAHSFVVDSGKALLKKYLVSQGKKASLAAYRELNDNGLEAANKAAGVTGTPRWSPDGSRIVFDAHPGTYSTVYVVSASGGTPRPLTDAKAEDMMPSWSHDGQWIYFVSRRSGSEQIWKIPSGGGSAVQITHQIGREALESPDGRTLYYHGGPQRGIWQVPVDGGEESAVPELAQMPPSRYWTVTSRGIFFAPLSTGSREFRFFDFETRRIRPVMTIAKDPAFGTPSLAVTQDHETILHAQMDQSGSDIMMIERR